MRAVVVIPTYNERENIVDLVDQIQQLPEPPATLIVDDNSPDGTGDLADSLARERSNVYVLHRPRKLGLGTAHIAGFRYALAENYDFVLTMDADFSHHPKYIPGLIEACRQCDVAIGSRYVRGGGTRHCRLRRRMLSWIANLVARFTLGLQARDCTAGFRCYHRQVLESIKLDAVFSDGYSFLIEMLFRIQTRGFQIGEVPIIYEDRWQGRSKISRQEILKAVYTVLRLGWNQRLGRLAPSG
ncbi:MAG: polyprenol monophosphomannose synthase [Anaerolineae bacterium]